MAIRKQAIRAYCHWAARSVAPSGQAFIALFYSTFIPQLLHGSSAGKNRAINLPNARSEVSRMWLSDSVMSRRPSENLSGKNSFRHDGRSAAEKKIRNLYFIGVKT